MPEFQSLPTFTDGAIMSASYHLNTLRDGAQALFDDLVSLHEVFAGVDERETYEAWFIYTGATDVEYEYEIIHTSGMADSFAFNIYYDNATDDTKYNSTPAQIPGTLNSGTGTHTGTGSLDNFSSNLTVGRAYRIVGGSKNARVWKLKITQTVTQPTLITFADEVVPTATEWNDLVDYTENLNTLLAYPHGAVCGGRNKRTMIEENSPTGYILDPYAFIGSFVWRGQQYLYYRIEVISPSQYDDGNVAVAGVAERWTHADLYVDSMDDADSLLRLRNGTAITDFTGWPTNRQTNSDNTTSSHTFTGVIDLLTLGLGLSVGTTYKIRVRSTCSTRNGDGRGIRVENLCLMPSTNPGISGYEFMPKWLYGYYVRGDAGYAQVDRLKDNLEYLNGAAGYLEYPSRIQTTESAGTPDWRIGGSKWLFRRNRYLWYRNAENTQPKLVYKYKDKDNIEIGLTDVYEAGKPTQVGVYDLDTAEGLFAGVEYEIRNVVWAMEYETNEAADAKE